MVLFPTTVSSNLLVIFIIFLGYPYSNAIILNLYVYEAVLLDMRQSLILEYVLPIISYYLFMIIIGGGLILGNDKVDRMGVLLTIILM